MNNQIKPRLTKSCISSKNILDLCYFTIFNKNIIDNIKLYLIEYTYGSALFNKECHFNNMTLYSIIRFISKYNFLNNTNIEFNKILYDINKTPNHKTIDLTFFLNYFNLEFLNRQCSIQDVINLLINNDKNNFNTMVEYVYNNDIEQIILNKPYILYKDNISLQDCLINNSQYHKYGAVYSKSLILNNDIITFQIAGPQLKKCHLFKIPLILNLPAFTFYQNVKSNYKLISAITNETSIVILEKSNKYYHYTYNKAILINSATFNNLINHKAIILFYEKIK